MSFNYTYIVTKKESCRSNPGIVARKGLAEDDASRNQMDEEIISNYFAKMNQMYDLKTAVGVEVYINHMKKEM